MPVIILASLENNDPSGVMLLGKRCPGQAVASRAIASHEIKTPFPEVQIMRGALRI